MRASFYILLVGIVITSSVLAGYWEEAVPIDSPLDGYSDEAEAKKAFAECLAGLRVYIDGLRAQALKDHPIAAALAEMPREIQRTIHKSPDGRPQPHWALLWRKGGHDLGPFCVMIVYDDLGQTKEWKNRLEGVGFQSLDVALTNRLAIVYQIHLEDLEASKKVQDMLTSAFSALHKAAKK